MLHARKLALSPQKNTLLQTPPLAVGNQCAIGFGSFPATNLLEETNWSTPNLKWSHRLIEPTPKIQVRWTHKKVEQAESTPTNYAPNDLQDGGRSAPAAPIEAGYGPQPYNGRAAILEVI